MPAPDRRYYDDVRSELQALADARAAVHERLMALPDDELYALRHAVHEQMLYAQAELRVLTRLKNSLGKVDEAAAS